MRIVDLSHIIESLPEDLPAFMQVRVDYTDHKAGAAELEAAFGVPVRLMRNEEGPTGERLSMGTHAATTWMHRGTTTRRSRVSHPQRLMSCRWSGSLGQV